MSLLVLIVAISGAVVVLLAFSVRRIGEGESGVIFRTGRLRGVEEGPGIVFLIPFVDTMTRVDRSPRTIGVTVGDVATDDGLRVGIDASVRYRIVDPARSLTEVADLDSAMREMITFALRDMISKTHLDEIDVQLSTVGDDPRHAFGQTDDPRGIEIVGFEAGPVRRQA